MKNKLLIKTLSTFSLLILLSQNRLIAATTKTVDPNYLSNLMGNLVLIVGAIIIVATILYLFHFSFMLMEIQKLRLYKEQGIKISAPIPKEPFWQQLYQKATQLVPVNQESEIMLDHDYDGIRELDNSLPPWWIAMFYITIIMGSSYMAYYHYYDYGLSSAELYALDMENAEKAKLRFLEKQANTIDESNIAALVDLASLSSGKSIFLNNCAVCHGQLGEGGVGPNLTDNYSLHGADIKSVFTTIKYGVPEKGMIAWKAQLRPLAIHEVSSYLLTLQGTTPPNPKAPQGHLIETGEEQEIVKDTIIGQETIGMN